MGVISQYSKEGETEPSDTTVTTSKDNYFIWGVFSGVYILLNDRCIFLTNKKKMD